MCSCNIDKLLFCLSQASNLIYVDQPTGTGFSYSSDSRDTRHNEAAISNDLYDFLQVDYPFFEHDAFSYMWKSNFAVWCGLSQGEHSCCISFMIRTRLSCHPF